MAKALADQLEEVVACIALAIVVLAVSWGVITRYIIAQPAAWASELATLAFAWLIFFGATACIKYRLHPNIDMVVRRLPQRLQVGVRLVQSCAVDRLLRLHGLVWHPLRRGCLGEPKPGDAASLDLAVRARRILLRLDGRALRPDHERKIVGHRRAAGNACGLTGSRRS